MNKTTYCPKCNKEVTYHVERRDIKEFRGVQVDTYEDVAICSECGEDVIEYDLDNENLKRRFKSYKQKTGMVMPEGIKAYRAKHGLSQQELADKLGWNRVTLARYENGSLQSKEHDGILRRLLVKELIIMREG